MIDVDDLGKRYRQQWALRKCSFTVPAGALCALVGENGAGKSTLLRILVGLANPTEGRVTVAGRAPSNDPAFLRDVGYLCQDSPLYRTWTVEDHLRLGRHLNPRWDDHAARQRLDKLCIPLDRRADALSGGMRAQVALSLALAKRPRVLFLDEPVAAIDPLARRDFLAALVAEMADGEVTAVLSSHLLADLERVCDHVVVLHHGHVSLCGDIDDVQARHKVLVAATRDTTILERAHHVVHIDRTDRQVSVIARLDGPIAEPGWTVADAGLEEIVLAYLGQRVPDKDRQAS